MRDRLSELDPGLLVSSAGSLRAGNPAAGHSVDLMAERGLDIAGHRSRTLTRAMIEAADLVLAMARTHLRDAVSRSPSAWGRSFTLRELVRRGEAVGAREPGEAFAQWLARAHAGRSTVDLLGDSALDDIADPIGQRRRVYEGMVSELDDLLDRLVGLAWSHPLVQTGPPIDNGRAG